MKTDDPVQYMFADSLAKIRDVKPSVSAETLKAIHANAGVGSAVKLVFQPMARNRLLLRIQNLEDSFDSSSQTYPINMPQLVAALWAGSNTGAPVPNNDVRETSITGNMDVEEMNARRIKWQTTTSRRAATQVPDLGDEIQIQPQQIRVFDIEFFPSESVVDKII